MGIEATARARDDHYENNAMLKEKHSRLLTAYVDDELGASERRKVEQLLATSPEARAFFARLQSDSKDVRALPVHKTPETLAEVVMETIHDLPALPIPSREPVLLSRRTAIPTWVAVAAAASLLLAVSVAAFWVTDGMLRRGQGPETIAETSKLQPGPPRKEASVDEGPKPIDPLARDLVASAAQNFGDAVSEKEAGVRLMVKELHLAPAGARLAHELKRSPAFLFDVSAFSSIKAVERFKEAFGKIGITVLVDANARPNLAKKQTKPCYILYAEDLRQEEVARVLQQFGTSEATSVGGPTVERMVMKPLTDNERLKVAQTMQVAVENLAPAKMLTGDLPTLIDPPPASTKTGKTVPVPPRLAVVFTVAGTDAQKSDEVRRFLGARKALRPGTLQVVMVIHEVPA